MPYGPACDYVTQTLEEFSFFREYRRGVISRETYIAELRTNAREVDEAFEGDESYRGMAAKYPADFDSHADEIYRELVTRGMLEDVPSSSDLDAFRERIESEYDHGKRHTFIHHDEARLVYRISKSVRPEFMLAIGSYYGYWAVWAMPGVVDGNGSAVLIDPDPEVCAMARENLSRLGYGDTAKVECARAEEVLARTNRHANLVLLDASGSQEHPDSSYHGKGIYGHLISAIHGNMTPGGVLAVHNDRVSGRQPDPLERFHEFCAGHFNMSFTANTPEGFGVYVK